MPEVIDSIADTIPAADTSYVLVVETPMPPALPPREPDPSGGTSWIALILLSLFIAAAIRTRKNSRFVKSLLENLLDIRERRNVFDNTVRESSLTFLLNILWCASSGVLLYFLASPYKSLLAQPFLSWAKAITLPDWISSLSPSGYGTLGCTLLCALYLLLLEAAYRILGNIFADPQHTSIWLRGFHASTALCGVAVFPLALTSLCYPHAAFGLAITAFIILLISKLMFIWQGWRIFFAKPDSWLAFIYYLCSLEIIPLIILYFSALFLSNI